MYVRNEKKEGNAVINQEDGHDLQIRKYAQGQVTDKNADSMSQLSVKKANKEANEKAVFHG